MTRPTSTASGSKFKISNFWKSRFPVPAWLKHSKRHCQHNADAPVQNAELWRQHIPKVEFQTFKGAGHLVLDEKRDAVEAVQRLTIQ